MTRPPVFRTSATSYVAVGIIALGLLLAGFGIWSTQTKLAGAIVTPGYVQAGQSRQVVQHSVGGLVVAVLVHEGESVDAGEVLVRLDTGPARVALAHAQEQIFDLAAQQDSLRATYSDAVTLKFSTDLVQQSADNATLTALLDGQRALFLATRATLQEQEKHLRHQRAQIEAQIVGIDGQANSLNAQSKLIATALENQRSLLSRGLSQAAVVLDLEREISRLHGELAHLAAQRAQAAERLAGIEVERLQRIALHRERNIKLAREIEQPLRQYRAEAQSLHMQIAQADIRAPVSGVVHLMQVQTPQTVLRPAEPLLFLVPQDKPRTIVVHVSPRNIDQVRLGQPVRLRLSSLDQQKTPEINGRVSRISADSIADHATGGSFFRVDVSPDPAEITALPNGAALLPGMPVEAFFQTGSWSPLRYLTKPVADYFARAFRES